MTITSQLIPITGLLLALKNHIRDTFLQTADQRQTVNADPYLLRTIEDYLAAFIADMHNTAWVLIESPYVDKTYRDSYYQYYAGKLEGYSKNCIRLSFFDRQLKAYHFEEPTPSRRKLLQEHFLGFLVIRPTPQNPIGRNVLSPRAFKIKPMAICQTAIPTTVNGIKLLATGFPHSSQDVETLTCSQTTLLSIMDYFGHRYSEYRPLVPSMIVEQLKGSLFEGNLPAPGLSVEHLSLVLKQNGFSPRIYLRDDYDEKPSDEAPAKSKQVLRKDFDSLLSCYVQSGIPIIVAMEDDQGNGHAVVCIGYELDEKPDGLSGKSTTKQEKLDKSVDFKQLASSRENKTVHFFDLDQIPRRFVFINDNHRPYTSAKLAEPTQHHTSSGAAPGRVSFNNKAGKITAFVVPLYRKVYLDAFVAKQYVRQLLVSKLLELENKAEVCLRMFLTSSRSYKDTILSDKTLPKSTRLMLAENLLPKLIWVVELTNPDLMRQNKVFGVALLDATEADAEVSLICAVMPNVLINFAAPNGINPVNKRKKGSVKPFAQYNNNLNQIPVPLSN
jgi:hypothetical protein